MGPEHGVFIQFRRAGGRNRQGAELVLIQFSEAGGKDLNPATRRLKLAPATNMQA